MCFLRHLDVADAFETLQQAIPHKDRITGIGLDSSELGHPPSKFQRVFAEAREAGFACVAHAGEEGPPEYVKEAIDLLEIERIDHGNRCLEDQQLTSRIAELQLPLTVCPLSNLKLCVVDNLKGHPLPKMLDENLLVTLNSDDPAFFGGYVAENFQAMQNALDLTDEVLAQLARNSFTASFLSESEKQQHIAEIDRYMEG